jgi:hypothetical protein
MTCLGAAKFFVPIDSAEEFRGDSELVALPDKWSTRLRHLSGYGVISNEAGRCKSFFLCSFVGSSTLPRRRRNCVCF